MMKRNLVEEAEALERSGRIAEAIERWRLAAQTEPSAENLARLGRLCLRHGSQADGEATLHRAIDVYPEDPDAYFYLGVYYKEHGDLNEARVLLEKSVELDEWAPAFVALGHVYRRLDQLENARRSFERAIADDPDESEAWFGLGVCYRFVDDDRAIQLFKESLERDPTNSAALREMGHMLWRRGNALGAEEHLRAALRVDDRDVWAHDYLGVVFSVTNRDAEAVHEFRRAIDLWPDVPIFYCHLGDALIRLGQTSEGEHSYKVALSLDVSNYLANRRMGQFLKLKGRSSEARMFIERALRSDPSNREAREALARLPTE